MTDEEYKKLPQYQWMRSRIPARDALSTFVPDAPEAEPIITEMQNRLGASRWYPVGGGHRVLMPHDGRSFDSIRFRVEPSAWDHEHCDACDEQIPAMTLCYVTKPGLPYVLLCASCFEKHVSSKGIGSD